MYIYIYIFFFLHTHTHTHTHVLFLELGAVGRRFRDEQKHVGLQGLWALGLDVKKGSGSLETPLSAKQSLDLCPNPKHQTLNPKP